jgi:putative transcriptional regulator
MSMMKNIEIKNLTNMFLVAVPSLKDPNFERSVVLICEHSNDGAFGLIINRVLVSSFVPFHSGINLKKCIIDMPVFYGGPVRPEQGYTHLRICIILPSKSTIHCH